MIEFVWNFAKQVVCDSYNDKKLIQGHASWVWELVEGEREEHTQSHTHNHSRLLTPFHALADTRTHTGNTLKQQTCKKARRHAH